MWERVYARFARAIGLDLKHSQERYFAALSREIPAGARWLDLGCGRQIAPLFAATGEQQAALVRRASLLFGVDVDDAVKEHPLLHLRAAALGQNLPFRDNSFDVITANMVMEHLPEPSAIFREAERVLAPGGKLIFHTPNRKYPYIRLARLIGDRLKQTIVWWLERRADKDVFPTHYRANTVEDIRRLADGAHLQVSGIQVGGSVGTMNLLGPVGLVELLFLRLLASPRLNHLNTTIIAVLEKPAREVTVRLQHAAEPAAR